MYDFGSDLAMIANISVNTSDIVAVGMINSVQYYGRCMIFTSNQWLPCPCSGVSDFPS